MSRLDGPATSGPVSFLGGFVRKLSAGCASQRPVLYPNEKYKQVGDEGARRDIDECMRLAEQSEAAHGGGEQAARNVRSWAARPEWLPGR